MFCDQLRDHCGSSLPLPQRSSKGGLIVPVDTHTSRGAVFATEVSIQGHLLAPSPLLGLNILGTFFGFAFSSWEYFLIISHCREPFS